MVELFNHGVLDTEVRSISGFYRYTEEKKLEFQGRDVLYLIGVACIDNSCCGTGGFNFIRVAGYIQSWKDSADEAGSPISRIEPIQNEAEQQAIKTALLKNHPYAQVNFD